MRANFYCSHDFSEAELVEIAATLGLAPGDERFGPLCHELREATRSYLTNRDSELSRPRAAKTQRNLRKFRRQVLTLRKAINRFHAQFEGLDEHSSGILATVICAEAPEFLDVVAAAPESLSRASKVIDRALKVIGPDLGGRPKCRVSLRRYVLELYAIYHGITGRRAMLPAKVRDKFRGGFFRFCKTTLTLIGHPIASSDIALLSQLKKVKIIKNKLSARKDLNVYPTIPER